MIPYLLMGAGAYLLMPDKAKKMESGGSLSFTARLSDINEQNLRDYFGNVDVEIDSASITVQYSLQIDARHWGIKAIDASVLSLTGELDWYVETDELPSELFQPLIKKGGQYDGDGKIVGNIFLDNKSWNVELAVDFKDNGAFRISEATIDFKTKKITLE